MSSGVGGSRRQKRDVPQLLCMVLCTVVGCCDVHITARMLHVPTGALVVSAMSKP
jgi:hypothetical protein